jgi:hypothetical protein
MELTFEEAPGYQADSSYGGTCRCCSYCTLKAFLDAAAPSPGHFTHNSRCPPRSLPSAGPHLVGPVVVPRQCRLLRNGTGPEEDKLNPFVVPTFEARCCYLLTGLQWRQTAPTTPITGRFIIRAGKIVGHHTWTTKVSERFSVTVPKSVRGPQ